MASKYVPKLTADERKRVEENFEISFEQFEDELKKEWDRGVCRLEIVSVYRASVIFISSANKNVSAVSTQTNRDSE